MKFLTFLDFNTVESVGKDFEAKLEQRDQEVLSLVEKVKQLEQKLERYRTEKMLRSLHDNGPLPSKVLIEKLSKFEK